MEYITLQYVPTEENVANIFTKPFPYPKFEYFINVLGLHYAWREVSNIQVELDLLALGWGEHFHNDSVLSNRLSLPLQTHC